MNLPIGVIVDSFKVDIREGVKRAAAVGAQGMQVYACSGEMSPENMDAAKRREFVDYVKSNGLVISALCGDIGAFNNPEKNPAMIERSKTIMQLAKDLDTDIVTTHIGSIPPDPENERYKVMQEACFKLSQFADSIDAHFAIETGPESSDILKTFLDSLNSRGVAVNLDPANLVMVAGDNPVKAVYNLRDYIVHTHAKDGIMHYYRDPAVAYGMREATPAELASWPDSNAWTEVALGDGQVFFPAYINALKDIGYKGFLTIEREVHGEPDERYAVIEKAVGFLKDTMAKID